MGAGVESRSFAVCDQYTLQADEVARQIRDKGPAPFPLEDSVANMRVIDALVRSAQSGTWETP
jgi:predicted dehydrogenase